MARTARTYAARDGNAEASGSRARRRVESSPAEEDVRVPATQEPEGDGNDEDEEDEPQDPRENWTIKTFKDVPIRSTVAIGEVRKLGDELLKRERMAEDSIQVAKETATAYEAASPGDKVIDSIQKQLIDDLEALARINIRKEALEELTTELRTSGGMDDLWAFYKRSIQARGAEYGELTLRKKYADNDHFKEFRAGIWEVNHEGEPIPPMTRWLERQDGDPEDDDVEMGGTTQTYKCPITMRVYEDAAKSTVCGHYYSYAAVLELIGNATRTQRQGRAAQARCPVAGCNKVITPDVIKKDPAMQRQADAFVRRQRDREEREAADESYIEME
ncbi:E3 SUMO-protein ligase nse2 [Vanrija pseudolonga]|uniref:E3 SUMO-protein ligase nse2 n=1 Tax=Vanrija pseudolonga TaxID=143232 RepID=A0AAF0Y375_9TREE|nr:E3 SUMO-protein ligase nse2 [Vanrija pseudolonga]